MQREPVRGLEARSPCSGVFCSLNGVIFTKKNGMYIKMHNEVILFMEVEGCITSHMIYELAVHARIEAKTTAIVGQAYRCLHKFTQ